MRYQPSPISSNLGLLVDEGLRIPSQTWIMCQIVFDSQAGI